MFSDVRRKDANTRLRSSWFWRRGEPQMLLFRNPVTQNDEQQHNNPRVWFAWRAFPGLAGLSVSSASDGDVKQYVLYHKTGPNQWSRIVYTRCVIIRSHTIICCVITVSSNQLSSTFCISLRPIIMSSNAEGAMYYLADLTLVFLVIYVKTAFSLVPLEERSGATLGWKTFLQKRK